MKSNYYFQLFTNFVSGGNDCQKDRQKSASGQQCPQIISLHWIFSIIIICSTNNYLLIKTSVPSSGGCRPNFIIRCWSWLYFKIKVNASGAAASGMLMLEDGWLPQGHGPVLAPVDGALPHQSQRKAWALTWRHQALMMIDHVVFFITLNPISACCNLSNDGSLLGIAEFMGFFILPHQ